METLEALQQRIATTESLSSLVGSMKALSAVSIRHHERAVASCRDYERTIELGLRVVLPKRAPLPAEPRRRAVRTGLVVFGSDYGLCGQFNDEIAGFAAERLERLGVAPADRLLIAVGDRAASRLRDRGLDPETELRAPSSAEGLEASVRRLLVLVDAWRAERDVGWVLLVYHQHRTPTEQRLHAQQLLPFPLARFRHLAGERWPSRRLPTFTMDPDRLFAALVRQYLFVACLRAFAESAASEHANRLVAMQAAERSIDEKLEEVRREFRRRRQDAITAELLDIVSGYEALSAEWSRGRGQR